MNKKSQMQHLLQDLAVDSSPSSLQVKRKGELVDVGLVNQFALHDFIPNKWFDWLDRADAKYMIIGQDWGPYIFLKKYIEDYEKASKEKDFDYQKFLFKTFSSRTEKFIFKAIEKTYTEKYGKFKEKIFEDFFFTVAVMFTRQGKHFRGNHNLDEKQSFEISYPYLSRQIDIVQPKVILTLGGLAFKAVQRKYNLDFGKKTISQIIRELGDDVIRVENGKTIIIPLFHPAAHVDPKIMLEGWKKIWDF